MANIQPVLSLRIGNEFAGFSVTNRVTNELHELAYCSTDEWNEGELSELFFSFPVLNKSFYDIQVAWDFNRSSLVPSTKYDYQNAAQLLDTVCGLSPGEITISEAVAECQLQNVFSVPQQVHDWVKEKFPAAKSRNQFSLSIRKINAAEAQGIMLVDFRKNNFTVMVAKGSRFLLAQTFEYTTPEDVLYYLLKTTKQFSLSQQEVQLQLSGLIDKDSALYKELYQYFINISFGEADWKGGNEYPAHFFTSLNDLAKCAL
jgi:Protein of unknown function (DUF3822)